MDTHTRLEKKALAGLADEDLINRLETLQPDEAARLLRKLPAARRGAVRAKIAADRRSEIGRLADYSEEVAGGLMNSRYADVEPDTLCRDAVRQLVAEDEAETIYVAFVVDGDRRLIGRVGLRELLSAPREAVVRDIMAKAVDALNVDMPAEVAARSVSQSGLSVLPVVDAAGRLIGIVSHADASARLEEEASEDMERFAAVTGETQADYFSVPIWRDFLRRAPWILSLAIVGLLAGYVVHVYENALDALVILALYMPMVADTGGNVGTQTSGLLIRSIAMGRVTVASGFRVLGREIRVAMMLAAMLFAFAWLKVMFISNSADVPTGLTLNTIAFAIGVAIAIQVITSALIGAVLPLFALTIRQDPAVMAGPALTTIVDTTGLLMYFVITTSILGL
ncbi:magnesium transporter [Hoeflea prorocentri]|uniref:Magnesium transporter MgtE n=1 Tax=Hoeflea prorocentri TaxID=1922333 RepID=A0A9X3ZJ61_9HYPH|nr:magnesium transporter [Hoeflea prorocentri]MCY6382470.1 magnesium transporter [Hoeflea prorocentri]MDA5400270.1 magnesium transporter [Hoeflea prorocentri]